MHFYATFESKGIKLKCGQKDAVTVMSELQTHPRHSSESLARQP